MRKSSGRKHLLSNTQVADYYANLQADRERMARKQAEIDARLDLEAAAARELPEWEREWLLLDEHLACDAPEVDDAALLFGRAA